MVTETNDQVLVTDASDKITVNDSPDIVSVNDTPEGQVIVTDVSENYTIVDSPDVAQVTDAPDVVQVTDAPIVNLTQVNQVATEIIALEAGETIGIHKMVSIISGLAYLAGHDQLSHADRVIGISITATSTGNPVNIVVQGEIVEASWSFTAGDPIYLDTSGNITQTIPITGFLQNVGVALSATKVLIDIDRPIMLH